MNFFKRLVNADWNDPVVDENKGEKIMFNRRETEPEEKKTIHKITTKDFDDRYQITDWLNQGHIVAINTEPLHKMDVLLLKEYLSGFCHCLHGNLEELTDRIFLATPAGYEIIDEQSQKENDAKQDNDEADLDNGPQAESNPDSKELPSRKNYNQSTDNSNAK